MKNEKTKNWHDLSGKLWFSMTNDYLFRALMQEHRDSLKELVAALPAVTGSGREKDKVYINRDVDAALTEAETAERDALRREYIAAWKRSLTEQLDRTIIVEPDGTRHRLGKKEKDA